MPGRQGSSNRPSTTSAPKEYKKSVSFAEAARMKYTLNRSDYDMKELKATFYCNAEIARFRKDAWTCAWLLDNGVAGQIPAVDKRGIEKMTKAGVAQTLANKRRAYRAVLLEQKSNNMLRHLQPQEGSIPELACYNDDAEKIAAAYTSAVMDSNSVMATYLVGISDERFVRIQRAVDKVHNKSMQQRDGRWGYTRNSNAPRSAKVGKHPGKLSLRRLVRGAASAA